MWRFIFTAFLIAHGLIHVAMWVFVPGALLKAACDCYVSLHRAEGFGLTLAEAMAHGKPVIATGYSGNLTFMNDGNSYLVPYKLTELEEEGGGSAPSLEARLPMPVPGREPTCTRTRLSALRTRDLVSPRDRGEAYRLPRKP